MISKYLKKISSILKNSKFAEDKQTIFNFASRIQRKGDHRPQKLIRIAIAIISALNFANINYKIETSQSTVSAYIILSDYNIIIRLSDHTSPSSVSKGEINYPLVDKNLGINKDEEPENAIKRILKELNNKIGKEIFF